MAIKHNTTQAATHQEVSSARSNSDRKEVMQRERPNDLGGLSAKLKLAVRGEIDGFALYWENDQDGAIEELLYAGFEFVKPEEVQMTSHIVRDADVADRISRYVGRREDGSALRAYLLKCPIDLWEERSAQRNAQADVWDNAIQQQFDEPDARKGQYTPQGIKSSHNTQFRKEY